ncbi:MULTISPECIES: glycogen synthase GlgA [Acidobacterium]|uniref:Glycogen synthase n=1 Tax=Acidobacterium capsulatum (strain ATCC 51196 / DSM 11244 / BCRC 80197 / JCM 7670 / NBRC 15755 / NCIMB 13165 / 161) TaxID=240015 RepID=C1F126_ACIC5|nr:MULTISPECIES: glycogen synthase GlgA [Acidobacterium]ACO34540.1 putative glycogen synthase [Acidobacterium capsulatum ATCC 51196]HCT61940.1 glycogen synthase GlgA [Acidobacterium sp.]
MHIVFAAPECVPFAKTGGLADVVGALPQQLVRMGHQVTVYLPYYRQIAVKTPEKIYAIRSLTIPFQYYNHFVGVLDGGERDGVRYYFVECPELFDREFLYGSPSGDYLDNWERFGLFARAVLEASKLLGVPDVFHVHDWQTGMLPVYLRTTYATDPMLFRAGVVMTVHNAGYQTYFPPQTTEKLLLPWDTFHMDRLEHYDTLNFLKGGIVYSDAITTVSKRYAQEIQTPEFGFSLEGVFERRAADLHGILNGVDYSDWDPSHDGYIAAHYTPEKLEAKQLCRKDLLHAFGAPSLAENIPVLSIVSRFATQKGFDILADAADRLLAKDVVLIVLGTGEPYYENIFREMQNHHPGKVFVKVAYDNALAHKVEAGGDLFLMPSRYEPCGLNQIYSLRYGNVPVVHATGGLDDTIQPWNGAEKSGTGFKFHDYSADALLGSIDEALAVFADKAAWQTLMRNGMAQDYSWTKPAQEYEALYNEVARRRS